jgi:two-component system, chemotaxis family, CheB/CheR fusion protein
VVAVTGFGRKSDVSRSEDAGFDAHVSKPVDIEELIVTMHSLKPDPGRST